MNTQADTAAHRAVGDGLKSAMRRMPSAVALVTTRDLETGEPAGLAASAVIPVSMDPPSMLVSINRGSGAHGVIARSRRFCINLLGVDRAALVELFSSSELRARRFTDAAWADHHGLPYLADAPSNIFCEVRETLVFGTHELFIGEVRDVLTSEAGEPLGWLEGGFARLDRYSAD